MKLNILYIHGFASAGEGEKTFFLRNYYKDNLEVNIIAPDLSPDPQEAMNQLLDIVIGVPDNEALVTIGTSLGGFYALVLNRECAIPAFVLNPLTLRKKKK